MPRLRPRREQTTELDVEWCIATEGFRPAMVAPMVSRGEKYRISDPVVQRHPQFFRGLVELTPEILAAGKR